MTNRSCMKWWWKGGGGLGSRRSKAAWGLDGRGGASEGGDRASLMLGGCRMHGEEPQAKGRHWRRGRHSKRRKKEKGS